MRRCLPASVVLALLSSTSALAAPTVASCKRKPRIRDQHFCLAQTKSPEAFEAMFSLVAAEQPSLEGYFGEFFAAAENAARVAMATRASLTIDFIRSDDLQRRRFGLRALQSGLALLRMGYIAGQAKDLELLRRLRPEAFTVCREAAKHTDEVVLAEAGSCLREIDDAESGAALIELVLATSSARVRRLSMEKLAQMGAARDANVTPLIPLLREPLPQRWTTDDVWYRAELCKISSGRAELPDLAAAARFAADQIRAKNSQAAEACERAAGRPAPRAPNIDWFSANELSECRTLPKSSLSMCATSAPAADGKRRFELIVRDMSALGRDKDHRLVLKHVYATDPGEYVDYRGVVGYAVPGEAFVVVAPIVQGTPDSPRGCRADVHMIRAGRLEPIYRSDPRPGCLSQQIMLSYAPKSTVPELIIEQRVGTDRVTLQLAFRGGKFVPPAPR